MYISSSSDNDENIPISVIIANKIECDGILLYDDDVMAGLGNESDNSSIRGQRIYTKTEKQVISYI